MWFMCLKWHKSIFHTATDDLEMLTYCAVFDTWTDRWQFVMSQWPDCSRRFSMDAFLSQWRWGRWYKEFVKYTSVPFFSSFIIERLCGPVNCLASDVIINWRSATRTTWIRAAIILQWRDSMRTTCGFVTELIRILSIWFLESLNYVNQFAKSW